MQYLARTHNPGEHTYDVQGLASLGSSAEPAAIWALHFLPALTTALLAEYRWDWGKTYSEALGSTLQFILQHTRFKINRGVRQPLPVLFPDLTLESVFFLVG